MNIGLVGARVLAAALATVLLCGGCGRSPSPAAAPGGWTPPATPPVASAAPSGAPASVSVPLSPMRTPAGGSCLLAEVAAGGGRPVPVEVDTGSSGLLLAASALGPTHQPAGRSFREGFVHAPMFTVDEVHAPVSIGDPAGVSTPRPILIGSITDARALSGLARCGGAVGLLGVGVGGADAALPTLTSPLSQLAEPLNDGFTITLTGQPATLQLGKPIVTPASVTLPLPPAHGTYPDGRQAYQRDVDLCWVIGPTRTCGRTNIDSGFSFPAIRADFAPTVAHHGALIPAGTPVTISAPKGPVLESFTTTPAPPELRLTLADLFGQTQANTGIEFFHTNSVGFDITTGQVIVTPATPTK